MGRRAKVDHHDRVIARVPGSVIQLVRSQLYSEVEGKVPFGAMSKLVENLLTDWLRSRGVIQ